MESQLNIFGIECRRLRRLHNKLMADQASALGTSVSFISKMENSKKPIPNDYSLKLAEWLNLDSVERDKLIEAANLSSKTISLEPQNKEQAEFALSLSRNFAELTPEKVKELRDVLDKEIMHG
jgi:transcriptional regulator with XRE-family HTH domain